MSPSPTGQLVSRSGASQACVPKRSLGTRWGIIALIVTATVRGQDPSPERIRYLRPVGDKFATECDFVISRDADGWNILSRTGRMEVEARYDKEDRLTSAKATLSDGKSTKVATVKIKDGRATVERAGAEPSTFDVPKGTIVTSAPDWSDVFLLCRRYDRAKKGKQEFPALWIHPEKPARRLTFSIEPQGIDPLKHDGIKIELTRYLIKIRDGSAYASWADGDGRMIRLIPLPVKNTAFGMTLEGYEKSEAGLTPPER